MYFAFVSTSVLLKQDSSGKVHGFELCDGESLHFLIFLHRYFVLQTTLRIVFIYFLSSEQMYLTQNPYKICIVIIKLSTFTVYKT